MGVPKQKSPWCFHAIGAIKMNCYEKNTNIFIENYIIQNEGYKLWLEIWWNLECCNESCNSLYKDSICLTILME
ncbi:hypothetical protein KFD70_21410 [Bacillus pfraonensis]